MALPAQRVETCRKLRDYPEEIYVRTCGSRTRCRVSINACAIKIKRGTSFLPPSAPRPPEPGRSFVKHTEPNRPLIERPREQKEKVQLFACESSNCAAANEKGEKKKNTKKGIEEKREREDLEESFPRTQENLPTVSRCGDTFADLIT